MVTGQFVAVEWVKVDKYGRKLGKVLLAGLDCNLVQVKRGLAWHYKQYQREQLPNDQQSYAAAEIEARAAKLGLWRDADPMPLWDFRHTSDKSPTPLSRAHEWALRRTPPFMLTSDL